MSIRTHMVEVFGSSHDVRSPFILLDLHPALAEEFSAGRKGEPRVDDISSAVLIQCRLGPLLFEVIISRGAALCRGLERKEP